MTVDLPSPPEIFVDGKPSRTPGEGLGSQGPAPDGMAIGRFTRHLEAPVIMVRVLEVFSVGSGTLFDHIFRMDHYPASGETVLVHASVDQGGMIYFGECSANIAVAAASLGLTTGLGMVVGDDFVDSGYQAKLTAMNVDISTVQIISGRSSGNN